MQATSINHVSLCASDLETSIQFFEDLFGMERIPTPNFGFPVQWLRVGNLQIHLFQRPGDPPIYHHVGLTVDDFEAIYHKAVALGIHDQQTFGYHLCELPDGIVQMYLRDPAGNLIEVNWRDASALPQELAKDMLKLEQKFTQDEENMRASLFLTV